MSIQPIRISHLSFALPHKVCFENFCEQVKNGERIAVIGQNGSGKSSLLRIFAGDLEPSAGSISGCLPEHIGYLPQAAAPTAPVSGGESLMEELSRILGAKPGLLILDEPTNHLDARNRRTLQNNLRSFPGTLIVASHDEALLHDCAEIIWHLENGQIKVFRCPYREYLDQTGRQARQLSAHRDRLSREQAHLERTGRNGETRASKSRRKQPRDNNKMMFDARSDRASGKSAGGLSRLREKMDELGRELKQTRPPERIVARFLLPASRPSEACIASVLSGWCGYPGKPAVLSGISLDLNGRDRVALTGGNGSGKTTLFKALLGDPGVVRGGDWKLPPSSVIGYLDQHYRTLDPALCAEETILRAVPGLSLRDARSHLNRFLFRSNGDVRTRVADLSGGEKMRLSLALIAIRPPRLLLLDEITNNVDRETAGHLVDVLSQFPGAMIVISHDTAFLRRLSLTGVLSIRQRQLEWESAP